MNFLVIFRAFLVLLLIIAAPSVDAHPKKDLQDMRGLAQVFFDSLQKNKKKNMRKIEPVLASSFSKTDRIYYKSTLTKSEVDRSSLDKATYHDNEDGSVTLAPIKHYGSVTDGSIEFSRVIHNNNPVLTIGTDDKRRNNAISAFSITFKKENGIWKIAGIQPIASENPKKSGQNDNQKIQKVRFRILDKETGASVNSRVHIQDEKGDYWPVNGHYKNIRLGPAQDVGGDVRIGNKTYAYVDPEFRADLPEGNYSIEVYHGMEYLPEKQTFSVKGTSNELISIALRRWINMNKEGWFSGDTHTHFLSEKSAYLESLGEDLNVINLLATKWGIYTKKWELLITDVEKFSGAKSSYSDKQHIVYVNQESRHGFLGHAILHPLKQLIYPLSWGVSSRGGEGIPGEYDYPPIAQLADKAHDQGAIVTTAHFPYPPGEIAVDVALGKIDSIDLFTFGDSFKNVTSTFHGLEMPTPVDLWYKFLNTGAVLPVTGGTDKMRNVQVVGSVRTYVHLNEKQLTYDNWVAGIKKGETFVTTGPMIWLTVDDKPIGSKLNRRMGEEILLKATIKSATPINKLELIKGGKVIATRENPDNELEFTFEFKTSLTDSTWIAARAYSPRKLDYQRFSLLSTRGIPLMAHTSPIYVSVDRKPTISKNDARFLEKLCDLAINWIKMKARFEKTEHKAEMLTLFEKAKGHYVRQIK